MGLVLKLRDICIIWFLGLGVFGKCCFDGIGRVLCRLVLVFRGFRGYSCLLIELCDFV